MADGELADNGMSLLHANCSTVVVMATASVLPRV